MNEGPHLRMRPLLIRLIILSAYEWRAIFLICVAGQYSELGLSVFRLQVSSMPKPLSFFLLRGLLFVAGYGALVFSFLVPSRSSTLTWVIGICIFIGPFLVQVLLRNALKRAAAVPEEANKYELAVSDILNEQGRI
jgi:hypothetical protein